MKKVGRTFPQRCFSIMDSQDNLLWQISMTQLTFRVAGLA
jgi:hypothetical protein